MPETKPKQLFDLEGNPLAGKTKELFDLQGNPLKIGVPEVVDPKAGERFVEGMTEGAPYVGRLAANSLPAIGSAFEPGAGTAIGVGARGILRELAPGLFGENPESGAQFALEGGKDLLLNDVVAPGISKAIGAIPGLMSKVGIASGIGRNMPGVREGAAREMSRQLTGQFARPETEILEETAKGLDFTPSVKSPDYKSWSKSFKELTGSAPDNAIGKKLLQLRRDIESGVDVANSQPYKDIVNTALKDVSSVRNWKLVADPRGVEDLALNKLLQAGFKGEGEALTSKAILKELAGENSEIYKEAISPSTLGYFQDLVKEIGKQEEGHAVSDALVRWSRGRLAWIPASVATIVGGSGFGALAGGTAAGIQIANSQLARLMSNPETAQLVVAAMRTSGKSAQAQVIEKALTNALRAGGNVATVPDR